jgi:hypothetical protein
MYNARVPTMLVTEFEMKQRDKKSIDSLWLQMEYGPIQNMGQEGPFFSLSLSLPFLTYFSQK